MRVVSAMVVPLVAVILECATAQKLQQYCSFTPQHTLCRTSGLGKACGMSVPARGVSQEDAAVIVAQHNQLRARVALGQETRGAPGPQPLSANMMQLSYDEELSLTAQRLADQCVFEHDCADCRQIERFSVGQNLFISFQSDLDAAVHWPRAMQAWYDEVDLFANSGVDSYNFEPATGHYTALIWGETKLIGCGFTMYEEGGWYKKLYVCNYGPTGNIIFTPIYRQGEACTACPTGTSCSLAYPGLCESELLSDATNRLAQKIATTTPVPDFLLFAGNSNEDTFLLFPSPKPRLNSETNNFLEVSDDIETKMQSRKDTVVPVSEKNSNNKERRNRIKEILQDQYDYYSDEYDDYDYDYDDYVSDNLRLRIQSRRNKARRQRQKRIKAQRQGNDREKLGSFRRRKNKRNRNVTGSGRLKPPIRSTIDSNKRSGALTRANTRNNVSRNIRNGRKNNILRQLAKSKKQRQNLFRSNELKTEQVRKQINRPTSDSDYDYNEYDEYNSLEIVEGSNRFTENDFDYRNDDNSVEQWYFDYYDYNLDATLNENLKLRNENETTTQADLEVETVTSPTIEEALAEIIDTDDLLRALNASDMTNIAALMTFFNNQDLFRMAKQGQSHRQTFNRLVTELGLIDSNISTQFNTNTNINTSVDNNGSTNTNGGNINDDVSNTEFQQTPASNNSPAGNAAQQELRKPAQTPTNKSNKNRNRNRPGRNNRQRHRNNNVLGKAVRPGAAQPFQIIQPFQLLQASGLSNRSSSTPRNRQEVKQRSQQQLPQSQTTAAPMIVLESNNAGIPSSELPSDANLQSFLSNFGKSSQVIRTNSLDSVRAIINSLPHDSQPLVFFRSNMGTIRQLSNMKLTEQSRNAATAGTNNRRTIRSTITPAMQRLDALVASKADAVVTPLAELGDMLLSCQDVSAPCPVVALSGNWTHGTNSKTNVVRSTLPPSMGGQLVMGHTIPAPPSSAACVTLSYNFSADRLPADALLPQVQVAVWPLGQVLLQEDLDEVSTLQKDGWRKTQVSFAPIRNPFMVVLSVEPNPGPEEVELALRGFMVTEGLC